MASRLSLRTLLLSILLSASVAAPARAQTCTPQSMMDPADRDSLTSNALTLAHSIQANDLATLRPTLTSDLATNADQFAALLAQTAPHLAPATLTLDQLYLLDHSHAKTPTDAEFSCSINRSPASTDFQIPALPPGIYGFAILHTATSPSATSTAPWRIALLLRRNLYQNETHTQVPWSIAGFYPKPLTSHGHDGVWYWSEARSLAAQKQSWNAYLFFLEAQSLLQPAAFVSTPNLERLRRELIAATPPALSEGISSATPLVVKAADGAEYRFTTFAPDDTLAPADSTAPGKLDLLTHLEIDPTPPADPPSDTAPARSHPSIRPKAKPPAPIDPQTRNLHAIAALVAAYPELRSRIRTLWVFADTPGQNPVITQKSLADLP